MSTLARSRVGINWNSRKNYDYGGVVWTYIQSMIINSSIRPEADVD